MGVLHRIAAPSDLKELSSSQLKRLATEIRTFLIEKVAATGGHLGPNLGVVELTLAAHRVFDSPKDAIIFDTGHQAYVHKIVTGRQSEFNSLRQKDGLSGYPSRSESPHDWVESSHASAAMSYADGLSRAFELTGQKDRCVVAIVGDGAMTGGMCWEALNNIATSNRPVIIIVNDNGRSYAPTIGGLANHLGALRLQPGYERALEEGRRLVKNLPVFGDITYSMLHGLKTGLKDVVSPQVLFADLGIKYVGPVDGHDIEAMEAALRRAKGFGGPVIVHSVTQKGRGYAPAENDVADQMHSTGKIDPRTGMAHTVSAPGWTSVFASALVEIGSKRPDVVAITAAMSGPTGLSDFGKKYPDRMFDVGIAEQHALTSAAGMALGGLHPIVAIYSTFLNRAFDQLLMDVALLKQPLTLVLDRAGVTGDDGASHNGMWDMSLLTIVPGMRVAAPRDGVRLREVLNEALDVKDGPTALRFPKGSVPEDIRAIDRTEDGVDILRMPRRESKKDVLLIAVGAFAGLGLDTADRLEQQGLGVAVVDPRWVVPVAGSILEMAKEYSTVVCLEDNGVRGGVGSVVGYELRDKGIDVRYRQFGIPPRFLEHASRLEVLSQLGLTAQDLALRITEWASVDDGHLALAADESESHRP